MFAKILSIALLLTNLEFVLMNSQILPPDIAKRVAHPTDCTKFIEITLDNQRFEKSCGPGTAYDIHNQNCGYLHSVGCWSQPGLSAQYGNGVNTRDTSSRRVDKASEGDYYNGQNYPVQEPPRSESNQGDKYGNPPIQDQIYGASQQAVGVASYEGQGGVQEGAGIRTDLYGSTNQDTDWSGLSKVSNVLRQPINGPNAPNSGFGSVPNKAEHSTLVETSVVAGSGIGGVVAGGSGIGGSFADGSGIGGGVAGGNGIGGGGNGGGFADGSGIGGGFADGSGIGGGDIGGGFAEGSGIGGGVADGSSIGGGVAGGSGIGGGFADGSGNGGGGQEDSGYESQHSFISQKNSAVVSGQGNSGYGSQHSFVSQQNSAVGSGHGDSQINQQNVATI